MVGDPVGDAVGGVGDGVGDAVGTRVIAGMDNRMPTTTATGVSAISTFPQGCPSRNCTAERAGDVIRR